MTREERDVFMARIAVDTELKERINEMQFLFIGVQEESLEQRLDDFHDSLISADIPGNRKTATKLLSLKTWLAAASVIAVVAVSAWWLFFRIENRQSVFADYFSPDPGLISAMSTSDNYLFDRAMIEYKTGNYEPAIKTWDSMQILQPKNDTLNYFLASALLAAGQTGKAIGYFEKVTASPTSAFAKDAYWYLALALVREGDTKRAIPFLKLSDHPQKDALLTRLQE